MSCAKEGSGRPSMSSDFLDGILGTDFGYLEVVKPAGVRDERLRAAIEGLTPKQRFVIECSWGLRDRYEYSFREIADFMGVSMQAVLKCYVFGMNALSRHRGLSADI